MAWQFIFKKRVEFCETDMAGIVHFSNFFRYMEMAEHAFIRSLGYSVHTEIDGCRYGWPRVRAECDYRQPIRFVVAGYNDHCAVRFGLHRWRCNARDPSHGFSIFENLETD